MSSILNFFKVYLKTHYNSLDYVKKAMIGVEVYQDETTVNVVKAILYLSMQSTGATLPEIAAALGTSEENTLRTMTKLQKRGIVHSEHGSVSTYKLLHKSYSLDLQSLHKMLLQKK